MPWPRVKYRARLPPWTLRCRPLCRVIRPRTFDLQQSEASLVYLVYLMPLKPSSPVVVTMRLNPNPIILQSSPKLFEPASPPRRVRATCVTTKTLKPHSHLLHTHHPRSVRPHIPRGTPPSAARTTATMASSATNGNSATNGTNGHSAATGYNNSKYDPNFTQHVIDLMSPETQPRHREILTSLIRHLHDFCRDVELKQDEWIIGVNYVNAIGQAYKKNRNEAWRVCDILGVES